MGTYPFGEHGVLHALDQFILDVLIDEGMGRHVEEQEVLLLRGQNAFLDESLGQALTNVS